MDPMGRPGSYGDLNAFPTNAASVGEWCTAPGRHTDWHEVSIALPRRCPRRPAGRARGRDADVQSSAL